MITTLRARVLYYYAAAAFARGQLATSLSPPSLATLLDLDDEPTADDPTMAEIVEALDGKLDVRWSAGRLELRQPVSAIDSAADVARVIEHWRDVTGQRRAKDTPARRRVIAARLREGYTVDQLCAAASALAESPFHRGDNPQHVRYLDVSHFARSAEIVDRWLSKTPEAVASAEDDAVSRARREAQMRAERRRS